MTKTLLITGAAGQVGTALRPLLRPYYNLRLVDRQPINGLSDNEESMQLDLTNREQVLAAIKGSDAILHLACAHGPSARFEATVEPNYHTTLYLLEAAQRHGVSRFIFASSHHVLGQYRTEEAEVFDDLPPIPDSYYGLSKIFGEAACAAYSRRGGPQSMVIRIGNADTLVSDARRLRLWVSARDLAELVRIGIEHPDIRHEVVYGVSDSPYPLFSNHRARELGYQPQDNSRDHLAQGFQDHAAMTDPNAGRDYVGGTYAGTPFRSVFEEAP